MKKLSYAQRFWLISTLVLLGSCLLFIFFAPSIRDNLLHFAQLPSNSNATEKEIEQALLKFVPYGTPQSDVEAFILKSGSVFGTEEEAKAQRSYTSCNLDQEQQIIFCSINGNPIMERLTYPICVGSAMISFHFDDGSRLVDLQVSDYIGGCP